MRRLKGFHAQWRRIIFGMLYGRTKCLHNGRKVHDRLRRQKRGVSSREGDHDGKQSSRRDQSRKQSLLEEGISNMGGSFNRAISRCSSGPATCRAIRTIRNSTLFLERQSDADSVSLGVHDHGDWLTPEESLCALGAIPTLASIMLFLRSHSPSIICVCRPRGQIRSLGCLRYRGITRTPNRTPLDAK